MHEIKNMQEEILIRNIEIDSNMKELKCRKLELDSSINKLKDKNTELINSMKESNSTNKINIMKILNSNIMGIQEENSMMKNYVENISVIVNRRNLIRKIRVTKI